MGRAPCCDKANVKKGPWSPEEDAKLKAYIEAKGTGGNWIALPQKIGLKRCGKSCRLRWLNYLRPNIKHGGFTEEEENIICNLYINIGSRWSIIAAQLPGRTDNDIKNYWNTRLKKKLMARQRKEQQAACRLLEQEIKRESETFLVNQTAMNTQLPYWVDPQTSGSIPIMGPAHEAHFGNQDQLTRFLMKNTSQFYDENNQLTINNSNSNSNSNSFQYPLNDQFYGEFQALNNGVSYTQWLNMEYDVNVATTMNNNNNNNNNIHQGQESNFPPELEVYLNNNLTFDGGNESYSGIDVGSSSTTSNGGSISSWGEMNSIVNTPVSSFEAYQSGMIMEAL